MKKSNLTTLIAIILILVGIYLISQLFTAHAWYNPCQWQCPTSSPTATPTASPSASPTEEPTPSPTPVVINPCDEGLKIIWQEYTPCPSPTATPTEEPSASPSATAAPTDQPSQQGGDVYIPQPGAPVGPACDTIHFAPTITTVSRNNPMSIHVGWSKVDDFVHDYKIEYGLASGIPLWNTIVTGNETDLNYLPFNHVLWVRAAGTENGCVGPFGEWIDP